MLASALDAAPRSPCADPSRPTPCPAAPAATTMPPCTSAPRADRARQWSSTPEPLHRLRPGSPLHPSPTNPGEVRNRPGALGDAGPVRVPGHHYPRQPRSRTSDALLASSIRPDLGRFIERAPVPAPLTGRWYPRAEPVNRPARKDPVQLLTLAIQATALLWAAGLTYLAIREARRALAARRRRRVFWRDLLRSSRAATADLRHE
jgi:hypothetical protein